MSKPFVVEKTYDFLQNFIEQFNTTDHCVCIKILYSFLKKNAIYIDRYNYTITLLDIKKIFEFVKDRCNNKVIHDQTVYKNFNPKIFWSGINYNFKNTDLELSIFIHKNEKVIFDLLNIDKVIRHTSTEVSGDENADSVEVNGNSSIDDELKVISKQSDVTPIDSQYLFTSSKESLMIEMQDHLQVIQKLIQGFEMGSTHFNTLKFSIDIISREIEHICFEIMNEEDPLYFNGHADLAQTMGQHDSVEFKEEVEKIHEEHEIFSKPE